MKNLMLFVHPSQDFLPEYKTAIKIQIDNSLSLGWKASDIVLATNFPYEYNGVKSLIVSDNNYCDFTFTVTLINVILELFDRKFVKKDEIYWYHDTDAFQAYGITESELNLGTADMGLCYKCPKPKWDTGSIFFKSSAHDIFRRIKEVAYKYKVYEENAFMALYTNNLLWATDIEVVTRTKFVPLNIPGMENMHERVKELNITYNFWEEILGGAYEVAIKPIKVPHIHFTIDSVLDSFMYGRNNQKMVLMPERLIKIFHKHGVKGVFPKRMKNLMVYINPEKKFLGEAEDLVKTQIDNSLELRWKPEDIIIVANFPYEYQGIKSMVLDDKTNKSDVIFHLLTQEVVKEAELWWFHDLDVFQLQPMDSSQIDLEDMAAGFTDYGTGKLDTGSFFFRKDSDKIFEWTRNRAIRLRSDETAALMSLVNENYRNINNMYKKLDGKKMATIFSKHGIK